MNSKLLTTQEIEAINQRELEKKKEQLIEFQDLVNDCLNNEKGKKLLEILKKKFSNTTDLNNPNVNYFRDGKLYAVEYLKNVINQINKEK